MFFVITIVLIISAIVFAYIYPFAKSELVKEGEVAQNASDGQSGDEGTNNVEKLEVNSVKELRKASLLGTTSEMALKKYPGLGLAKYFSLFCEGDATFTGADTEGRVAVGGGITATTSYEYQIGCENTDKDCADIIVGDGPVQNVAVDFGYTDDGKTKLEDNKIIAYSSSATKMNLDSYSDDKKQHFVEADLIDFKSEFERLREYSRELAGRRTTGGLISNSDPKNIDYVIVGNIGTDLGSTYNEWNYKTHKAYVQANVFWGNNEDENIFTISVDELERISSNALVFDVPYNSKVILNVTGNISDFSLNYGQSRNMYYPLCEEKVAEIDVEKQRIGYVKKNSGDGSFSAAEYRRDENGNIKPFIRVAGGNANEGGLEDISEKILFNFPDMTTLTLGDCGVSILAPNADVLATVYNKIGYMLGNLICKSYNGSNQLGANYNMERKFRFNINKIDSELQTGLSGAEFEIIDSDGNITYSWKSNGNTKNIELESGTYILKEKNAPNSYNKVEDFTFTIKSDGCIYDAQGKIIATTDIIFIDKYEEKNYIDYEEDWSLNNYNIKDDNTGINWNNIQPQSTNNELNLGENGKISVSNGSDNLTIPANETVNNKQIIYKILYKTASTIYIPSAIMNKRNSIIKYDKNSKVEWVANIQSLGELDINNMEELPDRYIIFGGISSYALCADESQTLGKKSMTSIGYTNPATWFSIIISIDKDNGKIINAEILPYSEGIYGKLSKIYKSEDGKIYLKSSDSSSKVVEYSTKGAFPTMWNKLYSGVSSKVGNISKISFEIDTSNATQYTERDLNIVVAENNGELRGSNWTEFVKYTPVKNGDKITTTVPLVRDFYPYYKDGADNGFGSGDEDNYNAGIIKFEPHFYRQNIAAYTSAVEVSDIDVKNIKVYWKEVSDVKIKEKITEVGVKSDVANNTILVPNEHIKTTIKITKIDEKTQAPLKDAVFGIYKKSNDELVYTSEKTGEDGVIILENMKLDIGDYYVKEITAPEGYVLSEEIKEFTITENTELEFTFENS